MTPAPDVAGAVVGWRRWHVEDDWGRARLVSPVTHAAWAAGAATVAHCRFGRHDAPAAACGCGLWAVEGLSTLLGAFSSGTVVGATALWGRVVVGERGWRGERGHPTVLFTEPSVRERTRERLARRYGVPVHAWPAAFESLVVVARERLEEVAAAVRREAEQLSAGRPLPTGADGPTTPAVADLLAAAHEVAPLAAARDDRRRTRTAAGRVGVIGSL